VSIDRDAAERAVGDLLRAFGHELTGVLAGTPARVVEAYARDLLAGEGVDLGHLVRSSLAEPEVGEARGLVIVRGIATATLCPHHLLPAIGSATVAYLPGRRLLGIGAIARLVDASARRLTMQESIGAAVVDALVEHAGAQGARCELSLRHSCLAARGARQTAAVVQTVAVAGRDPGPLPAPDAAEHASAGGPGSEGEGA